MPIPPGRRGGGLGKEIHVVEGGDAAAQHFGTGQQGARTDEIGRRRDALRRARCARTSQRINGRSSAKPRSRLIAAWVCRLTSPGSKHLPGQVDHLPRSKALPGVGIGQQGEDEPSLTASECPARVTPAGSMGMIHSGRISRSTLGRACRPDQGEFIC
jgi:hypothetical protein